MNDIVKFGGELFSKYDSGEYDLNRLEQELRMEYLD